MEEADHLADRVGVLAKRMLDIGSTAHLRNKHGYGFHIHLISKSAPLTSTEEMEKVKLWIEKSLPGAQQEGKPYHGQMRFNIPAQKHLSEPEQKQNYEKTPETFIRDEAGMPTIRDGISIGALFVLLEENKDALGLEFYSVSPSTFDEVFLRVVEKHNVGEEDRPAVTKDFKYYMRKLFKRAAAV